MTIQLAKLVSKKDNKRAELFATAIASLDDYRATKGTKIDYSCDYHIFFNFSGIEKDRATVLAELFELRDKGKFTIFDISNEDFIDDSDIDYYLLFSAACSFVTCASERIQEKLYELTGRLGFLVCNPIEAKNFIAPQWTKEKEPNVLWFGKAKDVMSVRPYLTKNTHRIKVATPTKLSNTEDRADTALLRNEKALTEELTDADIVFLPPTFTREGELRRFKKVEEALIKGAFVVAPRLEYDWENLAYNKELDIAIDHLKKNKTETSEGILEKQNLLKAKYSFENITESIKSSLELALEEPIFADFGTEDGENLFLS
jgi:hypothetical protein